MLKYDYKKIIAKMQEKHINIKDLIERPAMYRWNASTVAEVLKGQQADQKKNLIKKHFIGLSDNVTYTIEDITGSEVSKYHYEIKYNPNMWIPFTIKSSD